MNKARNRQGTYGMVEYSTRILSVAVGKKSRYRMKQCQAAKKLSL